MGKRAKKYTRNCKQRVSTEIIYNYFVKLGVIPLFSKEDSTIRVTKKVPFICEAHRQNGEQYRTYDSIHNKGLQSACKYCNVEQGIENRRTSYDNVLKCFEEKGATLISKEYISNAEDLFFVCDKHPEIGMQRTTFAYVRTNKNICKICKHAGRKGEYHYNWQGGISDNSRAIENRTEEYKEWVKNVFKKDDFVCQCCGRRGHSLCAHHLYSFSKYKCTRLSVNNGITLCNNCHDSKIKNSFHNLYGTQNAIPEDLYEYIQRYQSGEFENKE